MKNSTVAATAFILSLGVSFPATCEETTSSAPLTDPFSRPTVTSVMRRTFDFMIAEQAKTEPKNDWIRAAFYTGVMAAAKTTGDPVYLDQATSWSEHFQYTPRGDYRFADDQACGQTYLELYLQKRDPRMLTPIRHTFDRMLLEPKPGRVDWWWCDALFMAPPALVRLHAATEDPKYLTFLNEMFWDSHAFLFDPQAHLFYRDASFFDKKTKNGQKVFWSRGNGWVHAGLARVLQYLPAKAPQRERYVALFREMSAQIASVQGADGLWRPSLADPEEFPMPETSGTGFFTFAFAWGVNNGVLDRATYLPVVRKGWQGLLSHVTPEGKLGSVQKVAGAPGAVNPADTHEYAVGAFLLAGSEILQMNERKFDFGGGALEPGYAAVDAGTSYTAERGFGWTKAGELRAPDRREPDPLRRDFVYGTEPATFRVDLDPGIYRITLISGDTEYGNHVLQPKLNVAGVQLPTVHPAKAQFATLTASVQVAAGPLEVTFDSPERNWVVNSLTILPAEIVDAPKMELAHTGQTQGDSKPGQARKRKRARDRWANVLEWPDPTRSYVEQFRKNLATAPAVEPTGLKREDYLKLIEGNVRYFLQHQNADGAIIDPVRKAEFQYATPCFALSAAILIAEQGRKDLLEPASKAMDWATKTLSERRAATAHEDFYAPTLAHTFPLLKSHADPARYAQWEENIRKFDPFETYRAGPGGGNWNVVSASGDYLFHKLGLRDKLDFVHDSIAEQGKFWHLPHGLYTEGPMPYDHFPRIWAADMLAAGYDGPNAPKLAEMLRRAALTSLFMQSPMGELPTGGRSSHHQWNEAEQCVTYEIYAAKAKGDGDTQLAGAYKRAAHLALRSMFRWQRPSGEMWIVKNRVDPQETFGYEGYSSHSQYNLLAMAMLAIAYKHAAKTEDVPETPAPADVGGFVLNLWPVFHKVFANASGTYIELDTAADPSFQPTGLIRIHQRGVNPQIGPSDGLSVHAHSHYPKETTSTAIGIAWKDVNGQWKRLAEYTNREITKASVLNVTQSPGRVAFNVIYQGYFSGPSLVSENYELTPGKVVQRTELGDYSGPTQLVWPVLADDGERKTEIRQEGNSIRVALEGTSQNFTAEGAASVSLGEELFPGRNGWFRIAVADFPPGIPAVLIMEPKAAK